MQRYGRKIVSVFLVGVMLMCLAAGCGKKATPENLLTDMQKKLEDIKSVDGNMMMEMEMSAEGETVSIKMDMDIQALQDDSSGHMKGQAEIKASGSTMATEIEIYQEEVDGEIVSYVMTDGEWAKDSTQSPEELLDDEMFESIEDMADSFELSKDKVEVNGKKCFELRGSISGESVGNIMESGMMDSMEGADLIDGDALKGSEIPCTIAIYDDSILPAKISIDMKSMMKSMLDGMGLEGVEIDLSKCYLEIEYREFDKVKKIEIPAEVKEAAGDGAASRDDSEDSGDSGDKTSNTEPAAQSGELGDTWNSYTVQVNDKVLTLPCQISDLEAAGFKLDDEYTPRDYVVNADEYELAWFMDANGNELMVDMVNMSDSAIELGECLVGGISVEDYDLEEGGAVLIFPGGVQMGTAKADVFAKYGEADDSYEDGESFDTYTWWDEDSFYKKCEIDFDKETGLVTGMEISCYE